VRLRLGAIIPADVEFFEGNYLSVDQSALTGESLPVTKKTNDVVQWPKCHPPSGKCKDAQAQAEIISTVMSTIPSMQNASSAAACDGRRTNLQAVRVKRSSC
jgi:magnesium-transporting ATPase (P-type)